jgi:hypothetical protein
MQVRFRPVFEFSEKKVFSVALFMLFLPCAMLVACQGSRSNVQGQSINYTDRIMLKQGGEQTAQFQTEELTIDYQYVQTGNNLTITGKARFSNMMQGLFLRANVFHLSLVLADAQGKGLAEHPLATTNAQNVKEPIGISVTLALPPQAACMAFSYTGSVVGGGTDGSSTAFFHVPFAH